VGGSDELPSGDCTPVAFYYAESQLPKRNYGFEKRQKELHKERKKEEKAQRKLERAKALADETPEEPPVADDGASAE
jgi:hypothetical protein